MRDYTVLVGTTDRGLMRSYDCGESWPFGVARPIPGRDHVNDIRVNPHDPEVVLVGTSSGLYRSQDKAQTWEKVDVVTGDMPVYHISFHPFDPEVIYFGTRPTYIFRSKNRGKTWETLPFTGPRECVIGQSQPTSIVVDRRNPDVLWVGVEVAGVFRSDDDGETWTQMPTRSQTFNFGDKLPPPEEEPLIDPDIHYVTQIGPNRETVMVTTPWQIYSSDDFGKTWSTLTRTRDHVERAYVRGTAVKEDDPNVLFLGGGPRFFSDAGAIHRSLNAGKTWETVKLPEEPEANIHSFGSHAADPNLILACTDTGKVFRTTDGGETWDRVKRLFSGIGAVAWLPN